MERTLAILGIDITSRWNERWSCLGAPHRDMPGDDETLGERDRAEENEPDRRQEEDAGEGELGAHVSGRDLDVETQPLIRSDELGDGGADGGVEAGVLEADKALRHRRRQPDLEERPPGAGAGR